MKSQTYRVEVKNFKQVNELPSGWSADDYLNLLNRLDYEDAEDIAVDELQDMAIMALSDLDPDEAARVVIDYRLGDSLSKGQKQNLVEELYEDKLWEEYSEIKLHKEIFNISWVLYRAFPKKFGRPDIAKVTLHLSSDEAIEDSILHNPAFLCRLLNDGMDTHNIMYRLFDDKLKSGPFPEAEHIVWQTDVSEQSDNVFIVEVFTALQWVDELKNTKSYDSKAS